MHRGTSPEHCPSALSFFFSAERTEPGAQVAGAAVALWQITEGRKRSIVSWTCPQRAWRCWRGEVELAIEKLHFCAHEIDTIRSCGGPTLGIWSLKDPCSHPQKLGSLSCRCTTVRVVPPQHTHLPSGQLANRGICVRAATSHLAFCATLIQMRTFPCPHRPYYGT